MPSCAAMAPIAQHGGGDAQLACDLDQRPTAARQQGDRLPLELIRKMTPFLAHSTPFRSPRSLAKVSTNSGEAQSAHPSSPVRLRTHPLAAARARAPACARLPCRARSCHRAPDAPAPSTSPGTASPSPPPTAMPHGKRSALNASEKGWQSTSTIVAVPSWPQVRAPDLLEFSAEATRSSIFRQLELHKA